MQSPTDPSLLQYLPVTKTAGSTVICQGDECLAESNFIMNPDGSEFVYQEWMGNLKVNEVSVACFAVANDNTIHDVTCDGNVLFTGLCQFGCPCEYIKYLTFH